ncbi:MAG: hypothetical protein XD36_0700 [Halomonas sp. 54_146]|nr:MULTISPECIES: hypothetical protein [unclassified Halomonas]KUJ88932.1 MAG: hypothetical protein XD36_0700 [Halomonas sp. 54_146]HAA46767.1 hypothetical protein [Halomonas sp.]
MKLTRRALLKNSFLLGATAPLSLASAFAANPASVPLQGHITLYGHDQSTTELGLGLRQLGLQPRYEGAFNPLALSALPTGTLAAGFTDESGIVLLTSLLAGRGRLLALGRHAPDQHQLLSHRGPVIEPLAIETGSWQASLGREYARLALTSDRHRHAQRFQRTATTASGSELSFLVQL